MKLLWAMERETLVAYLERRVRLESQLDATALAEIFSRPAPEKPQLYEVRDGGDAHIPIAGVLSNHRTWLDVYYGEAPARTYDELIEAIWAADADRSVKRIVLDVNTGGGELDGLDDVAQVIAAAEKPVLAVVRDIAASAGYWLTSQADEIRATSPVAAVGSIGVIAQMYDLTEWLKSMGVTPLLFVSTEAPEKRALWEPGTDAGREAWIRMLDDAHAVFAARVAEGRGTTPEKVNADFGRGALVIAADALEAGMIDGIDGAVALQPAPDETAIDDGELEPAHSDREEAQAHSDLETSDQERQVKTLIAVMAALFALDAEELRKLTAEDKTKIADLFGFKADLEAAGKQAEIDAGKISLLIEENQSLTAANAKAEEQAIKTMFDGLVAKGKLTPKTRAAWEDHYRKDREGTLELLAAKGKEWDPAIYGSGDPGPEPTPASDIEDPAVLAVLKNNFGWSDEEVAAFVAKEKAKAKKE